MSQHGSEEMGTATHEHQCSAMLADSVCPSSHRLAPATPGNVTLFVGCMFSGKTTALIKHLESFPADQRVLFKHASDNRYRRNAVVSHNGLSLPAIPVTNASELVAGCKKRVTVVGLDEAHFFGKQIIASVQEMAATGISFVITALDCDSWGEPFPIMQSLSQSADCVTVLTATCAKCGDKANRTQRLTPIIDGNMIGGCESYEPRCAQCWHQPPETHPRHDRSD